MHNRGVDDKEEKRSARPKKELQEAPEIHDIGYRAVNQVPGGFRLLSGT
jgi:hypothetical protein